MVSFKESHDPIDYHRVFVKLPVIRGTIARADQPGRAQHDRNATALWLTATTRPTSRDLSLVGLGACPDPHFPKFPQRFLDLSLLLLILLGRIDRISSHVGRVETVYVCSGLNYQLASFVVDVFVLFFLIVMWNHGPHILQASSKPSSFLTKTRLMPPATL